MSHSNIIIIKYLQFYSSGPGSIFKNHNDHISKGVNPCSNMGGIILGRIYIPFAGCIARREVTRFGFF